MTTIVASASLWRNSIAASPMQGAVSRLQGSPTIASAGNSGSCSAIRSTNRSLVITNRRGGGTSSPSRSAVARNMLVWPTSVNNCFGKSARLAGQKRVPDPPAMIRACSMGRG